MLVIVKGNPLTSSSKVVGLDILSPRHPKLYSLIVTRLGLQIDPTDQVGSQGGEFYLVSISCSFKWC